MFTRSRRTLGALALALLTACAASAQTPTAFPGSTAVGQSSAAVSVTITFAASGTPGSFLAVTQGIASSDFALASGGTCATGTAYTAGQQCTANVIFQPKFPGQRTGAVVALDGSGAKLGTAFVVGKGSGGLPVLQPGQIDTIAGSGAWIYRGDGVLATVAPIFLPMGIVVDAAGNVFLSDSNNNRVRRIDAASGLISTVAGNGVPGFAGDGGLATAAMVNLPAGLTLDGAGNLYFVDNGNHAVRRMDAVTGIITTIAGTGGVQGYTGDGGPATSAKLSLPEGLVFDAAGNLFIADTGNNAVRRVDAATGIITTYAGTGVGGYNGDVRAANTATLNSPWNLAIGPDGSLYIADLTNNRVRKVDTAGQITTVAGTGTRAFNGDGSSALSAQLNAPAAVALDPAGNLYIADSGNNRVRKVNAATGNITTITGTGSEEFDGDAGPADKASLYGPYALFFDQRGNLLVADMFHNRIRSISSTLLSMTFGSIRASKTSAPKPAGLENDGNANANISGYALTNAALDPATTTCTTGAFSVDALCNLGVEFAPVAAGNPVLGSVKVNSDAANTPNVIKISGQALTVEPTTVTLTSSRNPSLLTQSVTFTATVVSNDTSRGGTVNFLDGTTDICGAAIPLTATGTATCTTTSLTLGQHNITASYNGDANNASSVSAVLIQIVKQNAGVTLTVNPNPAVVASTVTLTAVATATNGTPTGSVTFLDGSTAIGSANLNASGVATFSTSQLLVGTHNLTASYNGDANNVPGASNSVAEIISAATTTTTLATSNANVVVGTSITFTANVITTNGPAPTGTVQFLEGATLLGTGTVSGTGIATLTLSTLAPGAHNIVAKYVGDASDGPSTSSPLLETVQQIGTTTLLSTSVSPASAGGPITLTATVAIASGSTASGPITGQVTFSDASGTIGTASVNASGIATLTTTSLNAGLHAIVATYAGNINYASSASPALNETVNQTATVTALTAGSTGALAGTPVTLTATITSSTGIPTGTVIFRDGTTVIGTTTVNASGVATLTISTLSVGNHTITATYSGDVNYITSTSSPLPQAISLATTTLALTGPSSAVDALTLATFTVQLGTNGVAPTGAVTLRDGATVIATQIASAAGTFTFTSSTLAVGTHNITAAYAGDANNAASVSNALIIVVQQGATITSLQTSRNPQILNQPVTLTAAVTSNSPSITGSISFFDGATLLSSVAVTNGTATYTTSTLTLGAHTLTASYTGDTNHATSTSPAISEQIVQSSSINLGSSANPSVSGANLVFTAKVSGPGSFIPTGVITFLDGSTLLGVATLDATGTASFATTTLAVGSHPVTASYAGDANFAAIVSTVLTETITNANTQVALTASANPAVFGTPLTLRAVVTSNGGIATGSIVFTDAGVNIGSGILDATGAASIITSTLAPGAHSIVATYAGDGKASASLSVPLVLSVKQLTAAALATSVNPAATLGSITFTATITNAGQNIPTGNVTFTDGTVQLGTSALDATGKASFTVASLSAGNHNIVASYVGDTTNFPAVSAALSEGVSLRPTTNALTATATNPNNSQQVTLISVVRYTGPVAPTGTVTFKSGSTIIGSAQLDATGVATMNIIVQSSTQVVIASYAGDSVYAPSDSLATNISGGTATQFTLVASPSTMTVQSKQHGTVTLTIQSLKGFTDNLQFGCLGLPYAATCTFSQTNMTLKADGTATVQLTIDTGNPLGAGAAVASNAHSDRSGIMLAFLPGALLAGVVLWRKRRSTRLVGLLMLMLAAAATFTATGCAGLTTNGTPAGTYTFQVRAAGQGTGVSQSATMTLTVTQ